jgi:hypothetical protein
MTGSGFSQVLTPKLLPGQKNVAFQNLDSNTPPLASSDHNLEYFDLTDQKDFAKISQELQNLIYDQNPNPDIDMTKTYMIVVTGYTGFGEGEKIGDLISGQRHFLGSQDREGLMGILPRQSVYYKESEIDGNFEPEGMGAVLVSTFVKGHSRPDLVGGLGMLEGGGCVRLFNSKVVRFVNV